MTYNNETGLFDFDPWTMREDCLWLVEKDAEPYYSNRLYIIPPLDVVTEIEGGPDDEVLDALNALCRDHTMPTEEEYQELGLEFVPLNQRGFNKDQGYYFHS